MDRLTLNLEYTVLILINELKFLLFRGNKFTEVGGKNILDALNDLNKLTYLNINLEYNIVLLIKSITFNIYFNIN